MAQTASPYGLYVRKCVGARRNTAGNQHYAIPANVTGAMYYGAPVAFVATGGVGPVAASPTSAAPVCGVVQGARWISNTKPEWFPALPANTYTSGGRKIEVMVNDDPSLVMMIQASATLDLTAVGKVAGMLNWAAGNNATGRSIASLNAASVAASGDFAFRIISVLDPGAPFPDVLVVWNTSVHQMTALASGELVAPDAVDPEEQQAIFEEFMIDRLNTLREEQGLPPLPTPEELRKAQDEQREAAKKKDEERQKRVEQRLAERRKELHGKGTHHSPAVANSKLSEPVVTRKGDK